MHKTLRPKLYIAGPDVFLPNPVAVGERLKAVATRYGFDPLYPLDNEVPAGECNPPKTIFEGNAAMIREAEMVVANLNAFRGAEPDSGTAWEVGYAVGLGKRVVGYMQSCESMVSRVFAIEGRTQPLHGPYLDVHGLTIEDFHPLNLMLIHSIERLVIGDFEMAVAYLAGDQRKPIVVYEANSQNYLVRVEN